MKRLCTPPWGRLLVAIALVCIMSVSNLGGVIEAGASVTSLEAQTKNNDKTKTYNDTDKKWIYDGHWSKDKVKRAYRGEIHISKAVKDRATISINGSRFTLIYATAKNYGKLDVFVDDIKIHTIDQRKSKTSYQKEWISPNLGSGKHVLKFVHVSGKAVSIDAIRIRESKSEPNPTPTGISTIAGTPTLTIGPSPTSTIPVENPTLTLLPEATSSPTPFEVVPQSLTFTPSLVPVSTASPTLSQISSPTASLTQTITPINPTSTNNQIPTFTSTIIPTATKTPTPTVNSTATSGSTPSTGIGLKAYYVSIAGNNTDGKSWATAWKGLEQVNWNIIQPGDTIYVSGGTTSATYAGGIRISKSGTASGYITIDTGANSSSPAGHNGTVIIEGGDYCIRTTGSYLKVRNLLCQHASRSGFRIEGTGAVLENNAVRETYGQGIHVHSCKGCVVRGNRVTTFPNDGPGESRPYQTDGIVIYDSSDTLIERNWVRLTNQYGSAHIDGIQASTTLGKNYENITIQYNYVENTKNMTSNSQGIYLTQMEGNVKIIGNVVNHPNGNQTVVSYLANSVGSPVSVFVVGNTIKCGGYWCLRVGDDNPVIKNNIIWQTGPNQLVNFKDVTSCNPANIDNNLYYAPNSSYPFVGNCGRTWSEWRDGEHLDANGIFGQNPNLDSCFRPTSTSPSVGKGAILGNDYNQGLSLSLCGQNGPSAFLPVTLSSRGSSWDIGAYER